MVSRRLNHQHQSLTPTSPEPTPNFILSAAVCQPHRRCYIVDRARGSARAADAESRGRQRKQPFEVDRAATRLTGLSGAVLDAVEC